MLVVLGLLVVVVTCELIGDFLPRQRRRIEGRPGILGILDCIEALVAKADVEVLRRRRLNHVVIDLHINRRTGILILRLEAVHRSLGARGPVLDVSADILVRGLHGLAALVREADRIAVDVDLRDVRLVALRIVGLVLLGSHLAGLLGLLLECRIERAALCERVSGLPVALPVGEGSVLYLAVLEGRDFLAVVVVMLVFALLHALLHLLFLRLVAEGLHEVDDLHVLVLRLFERIVDPAVGLAAHIDEEICLADLCDILCARLETVQIHAVL